MNTAASKRVWFVSCYLLTAGCAQSDKLENWHFKTHNNDCYLTARPFNSIDTENISFFLVHSDKPKIHTDQSNSYGVLSFGFLPVKTIRDRYSLAYIRCNSEGGKECPDFDLWKIKSLFDATISNSTHSKQKNIKVLAQADFRGVIYVDYQDIFDKDNPNDGVISLTVYYPDYLNDYRSTETLYSESFKLENPFRIISAFEEKCRAASKS